MAKETLHCTWAVNTHGRSKAQAQAHPCMSSVVLRLAKGWRQQETEHFGRQKTGLRSLNSKAVLSAGPGVRAGGERRGVCRGWEERPGDVQPASSDACQDRGRLQSAVRGTLYRAGASPWQIRCRQAKSIPFWHVLSPESLLSMPCTRTLPVCRL